MKCVDIEKLILIQESGEISARQRQALAQHMANCTECLQFSADLDKMRELICDGKPDFSGPSIQTLANIRQEICKPHTPSLKILTHPWRIALAAAAGLVIGLTPLIFSTGHTPPSHTYSKQSTLATEIIPLITLIKGNAPATLFFEGEDSGLTALADELLRLQETSWDYTEDMPENAILPEDYQPTTLQWNNTHALQLGRYG